MKKNVYMVQATYLNGKTVPIPYAVGALAAYAWKNSTVADNYELAEILFLRENIDDAISRMRDPFYVGFSSYMWSSFSCDYHNFAIIFAFRTKSVT